ncbi:MAG: glycosyltransferase family 2 protein [Pseudomonadota bacterium]
MKISFIVLTYNRTDALLPVLRSLARQCGPENEVVIADDGSDVANIELLRSRLPAFSCPVRHIWHPDIGFTAAKARNLGACFSRGDYLVFIDGDCIPNRSFVAAHKWLAEPGCFVNGSRVLLSEPLSARSIEGAIDLPSQAAKFWWMARLRGHSNKLLHTLTWRSSMLRVKERFVWRGIRSCNMAIWRKDFWAVNGFDETFEGWGHEDADLVLRLSNLGIKRKNGFMATEVFHLWHKESLRDQEAVNKQKLIDRMKSRLILAEKGLRELADDPLVKVEQLH